MEGRSCGRLANIVRGALHGGARTDILREPGTMNGQGNLKNNNLSKFMILPSMSRRKISRWQGTVTVAQRSSI